jgi:hypothetical protein
MRRLCQARTRSGDRCHRSALPGRLRCRLHGGLAGRPRGIPAHPHTLAALRAGHARWLARMRLLKASGQIAKFPSGRKPGVPGRVRSADRIIARAQRVLEEVMMASRKPTVPALPSGEALPARPWDEMSEGEKLGVATGLALDIVKEILALGVDPTDPKMVGHVKDVALHVISMKIRVDESRMRQPAGDEPLIEYEQAVARQERLLGLRPMPKKAP